MKKKNILLIGGAGYIGTVVTEYFLKKDIQITSVDSLLYSQKSCIKKYIKNKNYKFIKADLRDIKRCYKILSNVTDVIILAGLVGDPITKKYPKLSNNINNNGVKNFIKICKKFKNIQKIIFISTCSNYGIMKKGVKAKENSPLNPLSSYAKHKIQNEKYLISLKNKVNFSATVLRFATAFGLSPRMRFDLTVNHFTKNIIEKSFLDIYDAHTWRPYCHVKDFARLIDKVLFLPKEKTYFKIFNAGSDENNFTKRSIIKKIIKLIPSKNFNFSKGDIDKRDYRVSFNKVKKELNFSAKYPLNYGIKEIKKALKNKKKFNKTKFKKMGNFVIN